MCIFAVVLINAHGHRAPLRSGRNPYTVVGALMVASGLVVLAADLMGWSHSFLAIEVAFIVLFTTFWVIQTHELWDDGLRPSPNPT